MFPGRLKTNHIGSFLKEPIKLSFTKWDGSLLKQITQLKEVNFKSLRKLLFCDFFFVTKKALRCWEGLCDKNTSQTLQISRPLLKFILSF